MQAPSCSREPASKAMFCPARWMKLNGTGALDEEHAQIAIATLGDAAKYRAVPSRHLLRYQTQPGERRKMTRTELIVQLLKIAIGLVFGAYFVWWSLQVLDIQD